MRRVEIRLDVPTRDGDTQMAIITNLPSSIDACLVAEAYRRRWTIEIAQTQTVKSQSGLSFTVGCSSSFAVPA
jgi:hypothetical protein